MALPEHIRAEIDQTHSALKGKTARDVDKLLTEKYLEIGVEVGSLVSSDRLHEPSHRRRVTLVLTTLRHVLPIWTEAYPENDLPRRLLEKAETWYRGTASIEDVHEALATLTRWVDEEDFRRGNEMDNLARAAFMAAAATVNGIEAMVNIDDNRTTPGSANGGANVAVLQSAQAFTYYRSGQGTDTDVLIEFWRWWSGEAVPYAWEAAE